MFIEKGVSFLGKPLTKKQRFAKTTTSLLMITLGAFLFAISIEMFLVPNSIVDGGIVGISIMLSKITGIQLATFLIILNAPFIYLGYKQLGKTFALQSFYGICIASLFTVLLHHSTPVTDEPLLAAIFGGIVLGIGVGIVLRNSGALDGTEVLAILISSKTSFSVGQIVMFFNLFILGAACFVYGFNSGMYSLIAYFVAFKTMDIVVEGLEESKQIIIISNHHEEIADELSNGLGRTVTFLKGQGAYSKEEKQVIFCVVTRLEEAKLRRIVDEIDEKAFISISNINDVKGGNFKKRNIH